MQGKSTFNTGFIKVIGEIGKALVGKDLREPSNFNLLFDVIVVLFILGLCTIGGFANLEGVPWGVCIFVGLLFILLCFGWIIYYTLRK